MSTSLRHTTPLRFSPAGLSDSLDETDLFPGAMASLQNLIPDPTTKNVWTCRPAAQLLTSFGGFTTPTAVSCCKVVGSLVYGMVGSALTPGYDQPFCYNLTTSSFLSISGVTGANVPATQPTTGDWTPPTMDTVGVYLVVTHPGFSGANYFGWFNTSNTAALTWSAGNLQSTGQIATLGTLVGGTGGTNGTYTNVPLTGGSGAGATGNFTVAGNTVTAVAINAQGLGYVVGDTLSAASVNIGNVTGFSIKVASLVPSAILFTAPPAWVSQFNGRAYFGINPPTGQPSVVFTDSLTLHCTNATQALTFGDNQPLIAANGLPLNNQLGGVIQSLLVFKGPAAMYQITGDASNSSLAINTLNAATGTLSPRSICDTPTGVAFLAPDGVRVVDFSAHVSDPIGAAGQGITVPFLSPLYPSRAVAACNAEVLRISVQNSTAAGTPFQEYWYDLVRKVWSGPHTLPASALDVYQNSFVMAAQGVPGKLFLSAVIPNFVSSTVENGVQLQWVWQTVMLNDNEQMSMNEIAEMQIKTTAVAGVNQIYVSAQDENASVLGFAAYSFMLSASLWGQATWGVNTWGGGQQALYPRRIDFNAPVVYNRLAIRITGQSAQGFKIGDLYLRRRELGYMQQVS